MSKYDDTGRLYWNEISLPPIGKAVTLFVREVTEVD